MKKENGRIIGLRMQYTAATMGDDPLTLDKIKCSISAPTGTTMSSVKNAIKITTISA